MTDQPFFIDAGPSINFFATGNQDILFATVKTGLHAPQAVKDEVHRKAKQVPAKFGPAAPNWDYNADRITIIPGNRTPRRDHLSRTLTNKILPNLPSKQKDLGETFVIINAIERAMDGRPLTYVIIDDLGGQELVGKAQRFLNVQRLQRANVGQIQLVDTEAILKARSKTPLIPTRGDMRRIYQQMRAVDNGLVHIDQTALLTNAHWNGPPRP